MRTITYSKKARKKLGTIKQNISDKYGIYVANSVMKKIYHSIHDLEVFAFKGKNLESMIDIESDYRVLFVQHNYIIYRVLNDNTVLISNVYHEKEDLISKFSREWAIENDEYYDFEVKKNFIYENVQAYNCV